MININEIVADFFLVGCTIRKLNIVNDIIFLAGQERMQLSMAVEPTYQGIRDNKHSGIIKMQIDVSAEKKDDQSRNATISVIIEGRFDASDSMDEERFRQLLSVNGAAALYSIARGKLEAITGSVFVNGKVELPFVNFIEYYNQDK